VAIPARRGAATLLLLFLIGGWGALAGFKLLDPDSARRRPPFEWLLWIAAAIEASIAAGLVWSRTRRVALAASGIWAFALFLVNLVPARWIGNLVESCGCFGAMDASATARQLVAAILIGASAWCWLGGVPCRMEPDPPRPCLESSSR